jgi:hypothetical protein
MESKDCSPHAHLTLELSLGGKGPIAMAAGILSPVIQAAGLGELGG